MVARLPNRGIAAVLSVSEHTVNSHVSSILGKLGVRSRHDAARLAVDERLVREAAAVGRR
jgi:DNA-binding NarL/FixJ family response regulator